MVFLQTQSAFLVMNWMILFLGHGPLCHINHHVLSLNFPPCHHVQVNVRRWIDSPLISRTAELSEGIK